MSDQSIYKENSKQNQMTNDYQKSLLHEVPYRLETYFYVRKEGRAEELEKTGMQFMLDSGAFSAFNSGGKVLKIDDYIEFINKYKHLWLNDDGKQMCVALDVIGSEDKSFENYQYLKSKSIDCIPVFHAAHDKNYRYLEYFMSHSNYIAVAGARQKKLNIDIFDSLWSKYLVDGNGNAKVRVHGLAITSLDQVERYPWFSVDSSTWVQASSFGGIMNPQRGILTLSDKSQSRHKLGKHLDTMTKEEIEEHNKFIIECGFDPNELKVNPYARRAFNAKAFRVRLDDVKPKAKRFQTSVLDEL